MLGLWRSNHLEPSLICSIRVPCPLHYLPRHHGSSIQAAVHGSVAQSYSLLKHSGLHSTHQGWTTNVQTLMAYPRPSMSPNNHFNLEHMTEQFPFKASVHEGVFQ